VDFDATILLLIIHSAFVNYLRRNGNTMKQGISHLQTSRKLMIQLAGRPFIIFPVKTDKGYIVYE
jgi:hypothetical protein